MTVSSLNCSGRSTILGDNFIFEDPAHQVPHMKRHLNKADAISYDKVSAVLSNVGALGAGQNKNEIPTTIPTGLDLPEALLIQDEETIAAMDAASIDFTAEMDTEYYNMSSFDEWLASRVPNFDPQPATQEALPPHSEAQIADKDISQLELEKSPEKGGIPYFISKQPLLELGADGDSTAPAWDQRIKVLDRRA
ncbi:MAG: hypothetical protein Q9157_004578 [Trypethelium eluteriae]